MSRALALVISLVIINIVSAKDEFRVVVLADGALKGDKYWNGDFYEFYGIPYATIPQGRDRYQAPLPPEPWQGVFEASKKTTICKQCYFTGDSREEVLVDGEEDCLLINLLVPEVASEKNLVPVVVYIHSGAFSGGSSNMANFYYLARHDVITISFNYRLGALGFACLGNKEIPGNAALKDQVAALRWINKNVRKFGGDPNQVTLAGFSVGATMAELLSLSKAASGLFNKLILESGSALSPFAINRDPISTARNAAISLGFKGPMNLEGLTEFYLNASATDLAEKSVNYYLKNSTFGFVPCIENIHDGIEPIITESPLDALKKGINNEISIVTGFSDMEGLSRSIKFGTWREGMNEDFSEFLPVDLTFNDEKSRDDVIKEIKNYYFKNNPVTADTLQAYVDYFSDSMFKYSILRSAKLHAASSKKNVYLYEFSYTGKLNIEHHYMDRIKGASHRDQTAYLLDFFGYTNNYKDLDTRERMTTMWTDFVKYGNPTSFESFLINVKWLPYTNKKRNYLEISKKLQIKKDLFEDRFKFWNKAYEKYYWNPTTPKFVEPKSLYLDPIEPKVEKTTKLETLGSPATKLENVKNAVSEDPTASSMAEKTKDPVTLDSMASTGKTKTKDSVTVEPKSPKLEKTKDSVTLESKVSKVDKAKDLVTEESKSPKVERNKKSISIESKLPKLKETKDSVNSESKAPKLENPKDSVTVEPMSPKLEKTKDSVTLESKASKVDKAKDSLTEESKSPKVEKTKYSNSVESKSPKLKETKESLTLETKEPKLENTDESVTVEPKSHKLEKTKDTVTSKLKASKEEKLKDLEKTASKLENIKDPNTVKGTQE